jgi:hypothetical protein
MTTVQEMKYALQQKVADPSSYWDWDSVISEAGGLIVRQDMIGQTRWYIQNKIVFRIEVDGQSEFFQFVENQPATEMQENDDQMSDLDSLQKVQPQVVPTVQYVPFVE